MAGYPPHLCQQTADERQGSLEVLHLQVQVGQAGLYPLPQESALLCVRPLHLLLADLELQHAIPSGLAVTDIGASRRLTSL